MGKLPLYLLAWLLAAGFTSQLTAQQVGFDNITIDDGLLHNNVNSIVQDQQGFIWFGTRDGLCRYDGYDFRYYAITDSSGKPLTDQRIEKLFVDVNGDIWVMPTNGGLLIFERATQAFSNHPLDAVVPGLNNVIVQSVFRDSRGYYWLGTTDNGVICLDSTLAKAHNFSTNAADPRKQITGEHCYSITEDPLGRIWLGLSGLYVNRYNPKGDSIEIIRQQNVENEEAYSYRRSLASDGNHIWVGTEGKGVLTFDIKQNGYVLKTLEGVYVRDVAISSDGELLVATDGKGLYRSANRGATFENITFDPDHARSLSTNALYDLFVDRDDNIWIGTYNGGVNLLAKRQATFSTFRLPSLSDQSTGANSVISFAQAGDDAVWAGLDGGGIWKLTVGEETLIPIDAIVPDIQLSSQVITSLYMDDQDILWAGTFLNGLNRVDLKTGATEVFLSDQTALTGLQNNNIWDIISDQNGKMWLATLGGGMHVFDPDSRDFRQYLPEAFGSGLSDRNVRVLYLDSKNNIWIGTERGGLNKLLPNRQTFISWQVNQGDDDGLRSNFIQCILEDAAGGIWVGTEGGGLHRLTNDETGFIHYGKEEGLPSNIIYSIEEDEKGKLWVGTSKGLAYLDPVTDNVIRYDQRDGLLSNQFNPGASERLPGDQLVFGNIKGINIVHPEMVKIDTSFPDVVFTDFKIFDESVSVGESEGRQILERPLNESPQLKLKHADNAFTISFAALTYTTQQKIQYAYRMEGFNENWITASVTGRDATYTNLDPGDYVFEVKASNVYGDWPDKYNKLAISIAPPFWDTWWFKSLVTIFLMITLVLALRYYDLMRREENERKLAKAEQEILRLKNQQLEKEVKTKNSRLSAALLQSAHKNKALASLGDQLKELALGDDKRTPQEVELKKLVRKISSEVDSVDYWEQFQLNFDAVHQDFSHKLYSRHPNLTPNDLRLCSLIRINLTNSEIGSIQNISKSGVEKSKYRLKQKLGLTADQDLNSYILTLE